MDWEKLHRAIERTADFWNVPGMAVGVVQDGKVAFVQGYGVLKRGGTEMVDGSSLFAIASCTKAFTAAAVAKLVDEKRLRLDDRAVDFLPGFQLYDPYVTREITIRDLLCHRSGLKTYAGDLVWFGTTYSQTEVVRRARYLKPTSSFRSQFGYQNIMFVAAGMIVEAVSEKSWSQFIHEHFLLPLGMNDTTTSVTHLVDKNNVAQPHVVRNGEIISIEYYNIDNELPAGGINSSVADMAKWIRMQLDWGKCDERILLSQAMIKEMWAPHTLIQIDAQTERLYPSTHFRAYGLGWFMSDYLGRKLIDHGGGLPGMISHVTLVPEENLGFVILTNSETPAAVAVRGAILDIAFERPVRDWNSDLHGLKLEEQNRKLELDRKLDDERTKNAHSSLSFEEYCGVYGCDLYGEVEVFFNQGSLGLRLTPAPNFDAVLEHWHFDTFRIVWRDDAFPVGMVTFSLDALGVSHELRIDVPNKDFDFTELELKRIR